MYAEKERGNDTFDDVLRQMRRWAIESVAAGPGLPRLPARPHQGRQPRLPRGDLQQGGDGAAHAAASASATRRSSAGIRTFYAEWQFRKAGTDDLRVAMEKASGQDLSAFFDAWIFRTDIPQLQVRHTRAGIDRDGHHRAARRGDPCAGDASRSSTRAATQSG